MLLTLHPAFSLSSVVECIWHHEGAALVRRREHVLPDGRFQIVLNLADGKGAVCGLRSQHVVIDTARITSLMGVVFRPGGALGLLGASALEFCDRSVALDLVWGPQATPLLEQLRDAASAGERLRILEAAIADRMRRDGKAIHPAVDYALQVSNNSRRDLPVRRGCGCYDRARLKAPWQACGAGRDPLSGATEWAGFRTPLSACGQSQHASKRQQKTSDACDGRKLCRRKADPNSIGNDQSLSV
jgi:hypothetical protein